MPEAVTLLRRSLHHELVPLIRDLIVEGDLLPGSKVPEMELCARFGVSRTPLREALKVLAAEGVVVLNPNRGATVATISADQIDELFPIMGALEALAGERACALATDKDITRIRRMHDDMVGHFEKGERARYIKLNQAIHRALFDLAGNSTLTQMYDSMMIRIHAMRFLAKKSPERWKEAIDDHVEMIVALEARDGQRLGLLLKQHLEHKASMVKEAMQTQI